MAFKYSNTTFEIPLLGNEDVLQASVQWRLSKPNTYFQTADLLFSGLKTATSRPVNGYKARLVEASSSHGVEETKCSTFLISTILDVVKKGAREACIKLVLPVEDGYVVRSDFLEQRLYGCPSVLIVEGFVEPRAHLSKPELASCGHKNFQSIMVAAAGGILIGDGKGGPQDILLSDLEKELEGRYSLPWLISTPIPERTIAILGHRSFFMMERWINGGQALGCNVVIFGSPGSWLEKPEHAGLIKQFLPIDMTVDDGLPARVLDALKKNGHKLDGITSTIDIYFDTCAKVSLELGLQTSPVDSIAMAQDKYATRTRFGNKVPFSLFVDDVEDFRATIAASGASPTYPIVVKPSRGWSSEGVYKVTNEEELISAVEKSTVYQPGVKIIVESYVDGPEVDANFLLWDGEIQFFEVVDDFPSTADVSANGSDGNFQELEMLYPSTLPDSEKELLREQIHPFLLESGFRNGIYHVEARIQNSSMEYSAIDGVTDLRPKFHPPGMTNGHAPPSIFILEVNVRCPGWMVVWATCYAYGVDYVAAQMLAALGDGARFKIVAQPFAFGAQASVQSVFVPSRRGGTIGGSVPTCEKVAASRPDLMKDKAKGIEVVRLQTMQFPGDVVPDPESGVLNFVAAFNLATRERQRTEMLRVGQEIRSAVQVDWV